MKNLFNIFFTFLFCVIIFAGCYSAKTKPEFTIPADACVKEAALPVPEVLSVQDIARAKEILNYMTAEEKVGQLIITGIGGLNDEESPDVFPVQITSAQENSLKKYSVGGVIFFGGNIVNDTQIKKYINALQAGSKIPLFISVDEEGGLVSRLGANAEISVTHQPAMKKIGDAKDVAKAFAAGAQIGRDIKKLGFNLDLAPVADVVTHPKNIMIARKGRAFGTEINVACAMVPQFVKGLQGENVSGALKHFPGIGDTVTDAHDEKTRSEADAQRLSEVELMPFRAGINAGVDFVMVSHVSVPNVTGNDIPASLSKPLLDILKKDLGFKGLVITDDMWMDAVSKHYGFGSAAVQAFNAGNDMLIIKLNFKASYDGLLKAVKTGEITRERLDESVIKILALKIKRGIIK